MLIMCIGCCRISQDVSRKGCTLQELSDLRLKTESNRVLVFSGYHNKITETGWLKQHEWIFSHFWRLEGLDRGAAGLVSGEYSFPDFQTDAFLLCPDKVFLQIMCIEIFLFFFLVWPPTLLYQDSTLKAPFYLNYLLNIPSANIVSLDIRASTYEFWRRHNSAHRLPPLTLSNSFFFL